MEEKRSIINVNKKQGSLRIKQAERKLKISTREPDVDNANVGMDAAYRENADAED